MGERSLGPVPFCHPLQLSAEPGLRRSRKDQVEGKVKCPTLLPLIPESASSVGCGLTCGEDVNPGVTHNSLNFSTATD